MIDDVNVTQLAQSLKNKRKDEVFRTLDDFFHQYSAQFESGRALTALLSTSGRLRQIKTAQMVWEWIDVKKFPKNTFHYNSMISAAEKSKQFRLAMNLLDEMTRNNVQKNDVT